MVLAYAFSLMALLVTIFTYAFILIAAYQNYDDESVHVFVAILFIAVLAFIAILYYGGKFVGKLKCNKWMFLATIAVGRVGPPLKPLHRAEHDPTQTFVWMA